jgi:hypothetical protein
LKCKVAGQTARHFVLAALIAFWCFPGFAQTTGVLDSVVPSSGLQGSVVDLTLTGSGFTSRSQVTFSDAGIIVKSARLLSANRIEATVVLSAPAGEYSVSVSGTGSRFSILPAATSAAPELNVSQFAGTAKESGSRDGLGAEAQFHGPFGAWMDRENVFVADYLNSTVRMISAVTGSVTTLAGRAGAFDAVDGVGASARFGQPVGVWADGNNVFVTDAHFDTVRRISISTGEVTTLAGSASDPPGSANGAGTAARFRSPAGIWGDGTNLYVCDSLNFTIRKITIATGQVSTLTGVAQVRGDVDGPRSVALFSAPTEIWGNGVYLYVVDGNAIRRVTIATGDVHTIAGSIHVAGYADGAGPEARFTFIRGIWGDGANLFIADSGNHAIRKMTLNTGHVTTVAGLATIPGNDSGVGTAARFEYPAGIAGDGTALYIVDALNFSIQRATAPPSMQADGSTLFELTENSGISRISSGAAPSIQVGLATIQPVTGNAPAGMVILGLQQNGALVSEVAFPASPLVLSGRILAELSPTVKTGLVISNPGLDPVTFRFYFTDATGVDFYSGQTAIPANSQIVAFLDQAPFTPLLPQFVLDFQRARTFTFNASAKIGITALRGFSNERGEFLMTALPVVPLDTTSSSMVTLPFYAEGAGWQSQVVLVNPTDSVTSGTVEFFSQGSETTPGTLAAVRVNDVFGPSFNYAIPPRSSLRFQTSGEPEAIQLGSVRLSPSPGSVSPSAFLVVSYRSQGVTVSETGVPGLPTSSSFRLYVENSGDFHAGATDSIQNAFTISNPAAVSQTVSMELTYLDGSPAGPTESLTIPAFGQVQMYLNQIFSFQNLTNPFKGIVRFKAEDISVIGVRARYNSRNEFLLTATPPIAEESVSSALTLPLLVNGAGYTTQLVLFGRPGAPTSRVSVRLSDQLGQLLGIGLH